MHAKPSSASAATALFCLLGPTLLAILYFVFFAQPLYETEVRFLPQPSEAAHEAAPLLEAFLYSPGLITEKEKTLGLRQHFGEGRQNPLQRLPSHAESDQLRTYFQKKVTLHPSPDAQLLTLRVQAFSPEFTKLLADSLFQAMRLKWDEIHGQSTAEASSLLLIAEAHVPDRPVRPRPLRGTVTVFVLSLLVYGIARLLLATIRDHTV